jgi:putative hydrolase of HD superfamily
VNRLGQQLEFIREIDKAKGILRRNRLMDDSRYENDAEHSWHIAIMAMLLLEHAAEPGIDAFRVVKMLLIHDLVEIDAGDTFIYDAEALAGKEERERAAAERVFGILPDDQRDEFRALWDEFEAQKTPEARYGLAMDRLQPFLHNFATRGHAWNKYGVTRAQVERIMQGMAPGSETIWTYVQGMIEQAVAQGFLKE